jgi:hypothetical protein
VLITCKGPIDGQFGDKSSLAAELLCALKTLLVLDNTESISERQSLEFRFKTGCDHWGNAMCCVVGGGVQGGRIVGSTNRLSETPQDQPLKPGDIHDTIFRALGVNPNIHFLDSSGRPIASIDYGAVIVELF